MKFKPRFSFIYQPMRGFDLESAYLGVTFNGPRSRKTELYFSGACPFRVLLKRTGKRPVFSAEPLASLRGMIADLKAALISQLRQF